MAPRAAAQGGLGHPAAPARQAPAHLVLLDDAGAAAVLHLDHLDGVPELLWGGERRRQDVGRRRQCGSSPLRAARAWAGACPLPASLPGSPTFSTASIMGAMSLQGPHHGAQKSTSTGLSDCVAKEVTGVSIDQHACAAMQAAAQLSVKGPPRCAVRRAHVVAAPWPMHAPLPCRRWPAWRICERVGRAPPGAP